MNSPGGVFGMNNEMAAKRKNMSVDGKNQVNDDTNQTEQECREKVEELDLSKLINPCGKMVEQRKERRWSERILKLAEDTSKGGGDSSENTHGGNRQNLNSFSVLNDHEIVDRSLNMGVVMSDTNFEPINILTEMENARMTLHNKIANTTQKENDDQNEADKVSELDEEENEKTDVETMINDNSSDSDDFTLVLPKRVGRAPKRLSISGKKCPQKTKKSTKGCPGNKKGKDKGCQGFPDFGKCPPKNKKKR
jgi:hypothetical protein